MSAGEDTKANELVIIRRRSSNDDGGGKGGGVWKIAYADFMTAMMAFFLVMWLINSTDKKVLTQIANYFNPVRLTDKTQMPRGLHENESGARGSQRELGNSEEQDGKAKSSYKAEAGKPKYTEEILFADPYGTLSKLAVQAGGSARGAEVEAAGGGGEAYRDPFDPAFVRERFDSAAREVAPRADRSSDAPDKGASEPKQRTQKEPSADKRQGGAASSAVDNAPESAAEKLIEPTAKSYPGVRTRAEAAKLEADIKGALDRTPFGTFPQIEVTVSEDGTLISLMDDQNFGMFAIASAEPRPATVVIMEKIASVLAGRKERLVIRGHTDGRPYKSQTYDNWRLSTARAHMARFMLVRGGVQDKRFDRIEGHADRDLRIPDNAEAAPNRRIEILLRKGT